MRFDGKMAYGPHHGRVKVLHEGSVSVGVGRNASGATTTVVTDESSAANDNNAESSHKMAPTVPAPAVAEKSLKNNNNSGTNNGGLFLKIVVISQLFLYVVFNIESDYYSNGLLMKVLLVFLF